MRRTTTLTALLGLLSTLAVGLVAGAFPPEPAGGCCQWGGGAGMRGREEATRPNRSSCCCQDW